MAKSIKINQTKAFRKFIGVLLFGLRFSI